MKFPIKSAIAAASLLAVAQPLLAFAQDAPPRYPDERYFDDRSNDVPQVDDDRYPPSDPRPYDEARDDRAALPPVDPRDRRYDGYCYQRKDQARATGTILGAIAGAALGNSVSRHYDRGFNTIAGAAVGASIGTTVGNSSVTCYGGQYYAYDEGYYAPPPPPEGYDVVYYESRPPVQYYERVYSYREYYPRRVYGRGYYRSYYHRW